MDLLLLLLLPLLFSWLLHHPPFQTSPRGRLHTARCARTPSEVNSVIHNSNTAANPSILGFGSHLCLLWRQSLTSQTTLILRTSTGRGERQNCRAGKLHPRLAFPPPESPRSWGRSAQGSLCLVTPISLTSIFFLYSQCPTFRPQGEMDLFIILFEVKGTSASWSDKVLLSRIFPTIYVRHPPSLTPSHPHLNDNTNVNGEYFQICERGCQGFGKLVSKGWRLAAPESLAKMYNGVLYLCRRSTTKKRSFCLTRRNIGN